MKLQRLTHLSPRLALDARRRRRRVPSWRRALVLASSLAMRGRDAARGHAQAVAQLLRPPVRSVLLHAQRAMLAGAMGVSSVALVAITPSNPGAAGATANPAPPPAPVLEERRPPPPPIAKPWAGRSGKLLARLVTWDDGVQAEPGLYLLDGSGQLESEPYAAVLPFRAKIGPYVGNYRMGYWPEERRRTSDHEDLPAGFIEVHRQDVDVRISTHLTLGDFIVRDATQEHVWPKYVVVREELIEKVELVIAELERLGIPASHVRVLSGFRSPDYNARGHHLGMAAESRHQYGDALDLIIDADRDGRMDDLNGDGRIDVRDAMLLASAVERIEARHPDLVGGLGVYHAMGPSGPFVHIDVRGRRARWGAGAPNQGTRSAASGSGWRRSWEGTPASRGGVGRCYAEGPSAVLCQGVN